VDRHPAGAVIRRIPIPVWVALVAFVNAVCWSVITPPFQVVDEPAHFAYVKQLAETGELPHSGQGSISSEEFMAMRDLRYAPLLEEPASRAVASNVEQRHLESDLKRAARQPRTGSASAGVATSEPPLYYAIEAIPYLAAYHSTLLVRLQLMRLVSALFAGLAALFTYLFVREALPGERWPWAIAGLCVALFPLLGFMSGAVNPESMLYAVSAALFFLLARAFRRGLSTRLSLLLGATIVAGLLTKLNFVGVLPGCAVGIVVLAARRARTDRRGALACFALVLLIAASPFMVALAAGLLGPETVLDQVTSGLSGFARHGSLFAKIEYMWQLYLPRLPGMRSDFPGIFTTRQIWFDGFVGIYGWSNVFFPVWVYTLALAPGLAVVCLCAKAIFDRRAILRARGVEFLVYALMAFGVMAMIAIVSYSRFPTVTAEYGWTRYLLPLLALLGALLALAARGAGRRWGPAVGALLVVLMFSHDIFSQLLVVARYYG
jgi:4-amino-4-deoxy-L-arabinose transferase-like glycosyltransferase